MTHCIRRSDRWFRGVFAVALSVTFIAAATGCGGGGSPPPPPPPPSITLDPLTLSFADAYIGGTYSQTFTIANGGPGPLSVTSVAADDAALASGITVTASAVPFEVAAGSTAAVTVQYAPTTNAAAAGTIQVASNDPTTPVATISITSTSSGTPVLSVCAMQGATVADGCSVDGSGAPEMSLGTVGRGEVVERVIALSNSGTGSTAIEVSTVAFDPDLAGYAFSLFELEGTTEVPVTLPFFLTPTDPNGLVPRSELRIHVSVTAPLVDGAISGESVSIAAANLTPATTLVPIVGTVSGCPTGKDDCDGNPANGCEVSIATDLANCGACLAVCGSSNASPTCVSGVCTLNCAVGYSSCDGDPSNGCETDTQANLVNCGACGTICGSANGSPTCSSGTCSIACSAGFADCDAQNGNGCEANLNTSPDHCGSCSTPCPVPAHATATCTGSSCGFACDVGWGDCDGLASNGCEVDLAHDADHCGTCLTTCSSDHMATRTCSAGVCNGTCAAGYGDCNSNKTTDGCETDTTTSTANCGICGHVCGDANGTASCLGGICQLTCNVNWANCDLNTSNGCETNISTDANNCNACFQSCSSSHVSTRTCTSGACSGACTAGWGDCNYNKLSDGCETDIYSSATNCGSCGYSCIAQNKPAVTGAYCSSGSCGVSSCTTGYYDMDQLFSTGCECQADSFGDSCSAATDIGLIPLGGSTSRTANVVPSSDTDYFSVTFATSGCTYHPKVVLNDASGLLRIAVYNSACGATTCGSEGGYGSGKTSWEVSASGDQTCYSGGTLFFVQVYAIGSATSCLPYTLTFSN